jgi:hypothetical protein
VRGSIEENKDSTSHAETGRSFQGLQKKAWLAGTPLRKNFYAKPFNLFGIVVVGPSAAERRNWCPRISRGEEYLPM